MRWIKVIVGNIVILIILLFLVEGVIHSTRLKYKILPPLEPRGYSVRDPEAGYDIAPNFATSTHSFFDISYPVWSNELGCFDTPYRKEAPLIHLTGDSFSWGWTPFEHKWAKVIERELGIRVLNCGVNGYGTKQQLIKSRKILNSLDESPSIIIVGYLGANDPTDDSIFPNYSVLNGYRVRSQSIEREESAISSLKQWLSANSVTYNVFKSKLYAPILRIARGGGDPAVSEKAHIEDHVYEEHLENVFGFRVLAEEKGSKLVFVLIPAKSEVAGGEAPMNDRLKPYLEEAEIAYIDLLPEMKASFDGGGRLYWEYDGHWNEAGNELAGKIVSERLMSEGFIQNR